MGDTKVHPKPGALGTMTGKEWARFTRSWSTIPTPRRTSAQLQHPAKFPEALIQGFIEFFTHPGDVVLDPFMGTGTVPKVAFDLGRVGAGIELSNEYFFAAVEAIKPHPLKYLANADAQDLVVWSEMCKRWPTRSALVITSPPYWNMLGKSRGNSKSQHRQRKENGLPLNYTVDELERNIGEIADYDRFLQAVLKVLHYAAWNLRPGGHMVVVAQNFLDSDQVYRPFAWDLAKWLDGTSFMADDHAAPRDRLSFRGEKLWCQDDKKLGIWGYPRKFVLNVHHHYCLIFRKETPNGT